MIGYNLFSSVVEERFIIMTGHWKKVWGSKLICMKCIGLVTDQQANKLKELSIDFKQKNSQPEKIISFFG